MVFFLVSIGRLRRETKRPNPYQIPRTVFDFDNVSVGVVSSSCGVSVSWLARYAGRTGGIAASLYQS